MLLGNLDRQMREFLGRAAPVMIPFFAFALGTGLDFGKIWQAGLLGIGLGVAVVIVTGIPLFIADRLTGGTGVAGVAASSTAGNAAAVPALIAAANPPMRTRPVRRPCWSPPRSWSRRSSLPWRPLGRPSISASPRSRQRTRRRRVRRHRLGMPASPVVPDMPRHWLVIADDLTGAADCAIAFAKRGLHTTVRWRGEPDTADEAVLSTTRTAATFRPRRPPPGTPR